MTILIFIAEALLWLWMLVDGMANAVLGLAGIQRDENDETRLPNWVGWSVLSLTFIAIGVLIYAVCR